MSKNPSTAECTIDQAAQILLRHQISQGYIIEVIHQYDDVNGNCIYWRAKIRDQSTGKKLVFPIHVNEDCKYMLKEPKFIEGKKPIYRQQDIINNTQDFIWITEGESCADCLANLGLTATTSGGSNSANGADWTLLAGRNVIIWCDANDVGLQYGKDLTEILLNLSCNVKWVDINKLILPDGGDCIDWLQDHPGASSEDVYKLPLIEPPKQNIQIDYPCFEVKDSGIFYAKEMNDSTWLCSWLVIKALSRDTDGINWGRVLEFKDADGVLRRWTMPMELLGGNGDEIAKELLRLGVRISPGNITRKLIVEYITNSDTQERVRCVLSTGWHNNCFVLPHKVFGKTEESILLQSDSVISAHYGIKGALSNWQNEIAKLCSGNSRLMFSVALAFAPPLLKIIGAECGGFHFRGESSTGKTTTLLVAASVWGGAGYVQNWRATDNALEGLAMQYNDSLFILDELSQVDSRSAGEVSYMLANGQGKARATKFGQTRSRLSWRLLFLSSGEISLASHMQEAGKKAKAGQEVRMVDIPAYAGCETGIFENCHSFSNGAMFSEALKIACNDYHGVAGEAFLEQLVTKDKLALCAKIQSLQTEFMKLLPMATHGQVKRVAQRFALVAAAGELATGWGITGWQKHDVFQAVKTCFDAWLNARESGVDSQEMDLIIEQIRHFFQENAARFDVFDDAEAYRNRVIPQQCAGFRRGKGDFYVFPKTFRGEICKGLGSSKEIAKMIEKNGWLLPDTTTHYKSIWVPSQSKTIRLYHFSGKVVGES